MLIKKRSLIPAGQDLTRSILTIETRDSTSASIRYEKMEHWTCRPLNRSKIHRVEVHAKTITIPFKHWWRALSHPYNLSYRLNFSAGEATTAFRFRLAQSFAPLVRLPVPSALEYDNILSRLFLLSTRISSHQPLVSQHSNPHFDATITEFSFALSLQNGAVNLLNSRWQSSNTQ